MGIFLRKGQGVSVSKTNSGLSEIFVGLGWDFPGDNEIEFDLDVFSFLLGANEKLISEEHLIFYNNLTSPDPNKSVIHMGDNTTGAGKGDDEIIKINLKKVPEEVKKIVFTISIFEGEELYQNFRDLKNAFVRLVNNETKEEVLRYNLAESFSVETALNVAELYREDGGWALKAVGTAYKGGIQALIDIYTASPQSAINLRKAFIK